MKYTFKTDISKKEYDEFVKKNNQISFMQEYNWSNVKDNWESIHCGLYEKNKLIAACTVLIKHMPLGISLFYIPRGYIIDYSNKELLKEFTNNLTALAHTYHAYAIKIDPNFCVHEVAEHQETKIPNNYSRNFETYHNNLLEIGYKHQGYGKKISDYFQPRYQISIPLIDPDNNKKDILEVKSSFNKRTKSMLGSFYEKRGVFFEHTKDLSALDDFMELIHITEQRQGIRLRNREYFEKIMKNYDAELFFGKIDLKKYADFLEENKPDSEDLPTAKKLLSEGKETITLSTSLDIFPHCKDIKMAEYLYAANHLLFPSLAVSVGQVYEICKVAIEKNCDYLNLGGVEGDLNDHLYPFKIRFGSIIMEFSGEYDYPTSKLYGLINTLFPLLKSTYKKTVHIFKR